MRVPKYEIFRGHFGSQDVMWLQAVEGLGNASDRMKEIASKHPGAYFVFWTTSHRVLDSIDTSVVNRATNKDNKAVG